MYPRRKFILFLWNIQITNSCVDVIAVVAFSSSEGKKKKKEKGALQADKRRKIRLLKMVDVLQRKFVSRIVESSIKCLKTEEEE